MTTRQSVQAQTCSEFEWLVVDGASTDGTRDDLAAGHIGATRWISERDDGIYDAFNKGTRLSAGRFVVYMCAGDTFAEPRTLARVKDFIEQNPGADLYYGDAREGDRDTGAWLRRARSHRTIWWNLFTHHQSMFYGRRCFDIASYDTTYRIGGDYAFTARLLAHGVRAAHMPFVTAHFLLGGTSHRNYWLGERENWRTRRELGMPMPVRAGIWVAHAGIRIGRIYAPSLYRRLRYDNDPVSPGALTRSSRPAKPER